MVKFLTRNGKDFSNFKFENFEFNLSKFAVKQLRRLKFKKKLKYYKMFSK